MFSFVLLPSDGSERFREQRQWFVSRRSPEEDVLPRHPTSAHDPFLSESAWFPLHPAASPFLFLSSRERRAVSVQNEAPFRNDFYEANLPSPPLPVFGPLSRCWILRQGFKSYEDAPVPSILPQDQSAKRFW